MLLKLLHSYLYKHTQQNYFKWYSVTSYSCYKWDPTTINLRTITHSSFLDEIPVSSDYDLFLYSDDTKDYSDSLMKLEKASIYLHIWSAENILPFKADLTYFL